MKFSQPTADVFVPQLGCSAADAFARTTHLCIAAHQDDIEIMAYPGIAACYGREDRWFSGVVVTDGAGSSRRGPYAQFSDEQMRRVRIEEQRKAAYVGDYAVQVQLSHPSAIVKQPEAPAVQADLAAILAVARPAVLYLHQPADKHDTHIAVLSQCLTALRKLPAAARPARVLGCEVWRDLDWLCDSAKQLLDAGDRPNLAASLVGIFDSQITGGKRYDLACAGRRAAHATYHQSHASDATPAVIWAMDLTPLVADDTLSLADFTRRHLDAFRDDVLQRLARHCPTSA
jgi:LmbE family N-acetylglucosaminyl deacetylase